MEQPDLTAIASSMPVLHRRAEFESVLEGYRMSEQALKTLRRTPFILVVGASGGGRNTLIEHLVQTGNYHYVVSDTTRPLRVRNGVPIEQNGVQYFFRREDEVLEDLKQGKFVEAQLIHNQQVSGISVREIEKAFNSRKLAITDIEVQGCATLERVKPDVISIFVLPPSFEVWMERLKSRVKLSDAEVKNRLETAIDNFNAALQDDRFIFIVNDKIEDAVRTVDEIARLGKHRQMVEQQAHDLAAHLRDEAQEYIKSLE
jgi:guanylate kinase